MLDNTKINLNISSILNVPLEAYDDFTFIVNNEFFKTTKIVADLLSNKICKLHQIDPTFDTFTINTKQNGDFSKILKLSNFKSKEISRDDIPFFSEVFEQLECNFFNFNDKNYETITKDNALEIINQNDENLKLYSKYQKQSSHFIATHFFEFYDNNNEAKLIQLSEDKIRDILSDNNLRLESEDQLIDFINTLYYNNKDLACLFEYVNFQNVSVEKISKFLEIFDFYDLTKGVWNSLAKRLLLDPFKQYNFPQIKRYRKPVIIEYGKESSNFSGILRHIRSKVPNSIFKEIKITSSSLYNNDESYSPQNVIQYENPNVEFCTKSEKNSWICFDFIDYQIAPSYYEIRSCAFNKNSDQPKSWIIEGSNDNKQWDILDQQNKNSKLNGCNLVSAFQIKNPELKKYRFLRMRQLQSWRNNAEYLNINCIEFYGKLI